MYNCTSTLIQVYLYIVHSSTSTNYSNNNNNNISITNNLHCDLTDALAKFYALYVPAKQNLLVAGAVKLFSKLNYLIVGYFDPTHIFFCSKH